MRTRALILSALFAAACAPATPPDAGEPQRPPGLQANPERVAFLCVTPGCDTTEKVSIRVNGPRRVAIKRILLSGGAADEFTFAPSEPAPFIVGSNASFEVDVRYVPLGAPTPGAAELRVTYTDAEADESPDRLEPGELVVPLVRRLVGEPILTATPALLSFGVVAPNETKALPVRIANEGSGNISLQLESIESSAAEITAALPQDPALAPSGTVDVPVSFAPTTEAYLKAELVITATAKELPPVKVAVEGTSLSTAKASFDPSGDLDFGELARGKTRSLATVLMNQGGVDLTVSAMTVIDPTNTVKVSLPNGGAGLTIAPLERVELPILIDGQSAGPVDAIIRVASNDPSAPELDFHVRGLVTQPQITAAPQTIDWGTLPVGWVVTKPVELRNTGWGKLTIKNVTLVSGSSNLFTLGGLPALPVTLDREQRIAVDVQFRAETSASFNGWLSIESDDPANGFIEVPLKAVAGTCEASCPIANGTASCTTGTCEVGSCNAGYFNTDGSAATGCECKELGTDPGEFCTGSLYKGTLTDNDNDQANHTGVLPTPEDVDLIRFWAEDGFTWFGEDFDVKIRLTSADPGIQMCVYRHDGAHSNECYFTNESCPSSRYYSKGGSAGAEDAADFTIKVFRNASFTPTCSAYTVFMSNGI